MENTMYYNGHVFGKFTVYVWDSLVLEQRNTIEMVNVGNVDATGNIKATSSSSQTRFSGYFLVNLNSNTYYQFNETDSLTAMGQLSKKMEGIRYNWDITNESDGHIDDFIYQKDTIISDQTYHKVVRKEVDDRNSNVYEVLLGEEPDVNFSFRPVSPRLSNKYGGVVARYGIFNGTSAVALTGIWKIEPQLAGTELEKVRHYQAWYNNHTTSKK